MMPTNLQTGFLETIASQIAAVLEREKLYEKQAETQVQVQRERLRADMFRTISHDLRTPLTSIIGSANTVIDNYANISDEVKKDFPEVKFLFNEFFDSSNNMTSVYKVRDKLSNTLIIEGDIYIRDNILKNNYMNKSGYYSIINEDTKGEWSLLLNKKGIITKVSKGSGDYNVQLYGISYWAEKDSVKLSQLIENEFKKGNINIFWDEIPLFIYKKEFEMNTTIVNSESFIEIDSLEELKLIDRSYDNMRTL